MATFDDMALEGKLTVYDKGFDEDTRSYGEYSPAAGTCSRRGCRASSRCGWSANTSSRRSGTSSTPRSDGHSGLRVVRVLERLQHEVERTRRSAAALSA